MLYIDKKTPATGQKGIVMDNIYLPLSDETPAAGRKGLFVQNSGGKFFLPLQEKGGAPTTGQKGFFVQIGDRKMFIPIHQDLSSMLPARRCHKRKPGRVSPCREQEFL